MKTRRGRKLGDGVLKRLNSAASYLDNLKALAYGEFAKGTASELAQTWFRQNLGESWLQSEKERLGEARVKAAKHTSGEAVQDLSKPLPKHYDYEAARYWQVKRAYGEIFEDAYHRTALLVTGAFQSGNAKVLRDLADAMDFYAKNQDKPLFELHYALLELAGQKRRTVPDKPSPPETVIIVDLTVPRKLPPGDPIDDTPRRTIDEVRDYLTQRLGREYDDAQIRRACKKIGLKLKAKPTGKRQSKIWREVHKKDVPRLAPDVVLQVLAAGVGITSRPVQNSED